MDVSSKFIRLAAIRELIINSFYKKKDASVAYIHLVIWKMKNSRGEMLVDGQVGTREEIWASLKDWSSLHIQLFWSYQSFMES